jgi:hypothetical protein
LGIYTKEGRGNRMGDKCYELYKELSQIFVEKGIGEQE